MVYTYLYLPILLTICKQSSPSAVVEMSSKKVIKTLAYEYHNLNILVPILADSPKSSSLLIPVYSVGSMLNANKYLEFQNLVAQRFQTKTVFQSGSNQNTNGVNPLNSI